VVEILVGKWFVPCNLPICLSKDLHLCHNEADFSTKVEVLGGGKGDFSLRFEMTAVAGVLTFALSGTRGFLASLEMTEGDGRNVFI
jgi:hypothetical protein